MGALEDAAVAAIQVAAVTSIVVLESSQGRNNGEQRWQRQ
jgi:hypothetical protein